jgi:hypothetical protein
MSLLGPLMLLSHAVYVLFKVKYQGLARFFSPECLPVKSSVLTNVNIPLNAKPFRGHVLSAQAATLFGYILSGI